MVQSTQNANENSTILVCAEIQNLQGVGVDSRVNLTVPFVVTPDTASKL